MPHIDCYYEKQALIGDSHECGDTAVILHDTDMCFIALIDVLGHGPKAAKLASVIQTYLKTNCRNDLVVLLQELHEHIKGSRGCVVFIGRLEISTGTFSYTGIGNINAKWFAMNDATTLLCRDGIVGYSMATPRLTTIQLVPPDIIILTSDGVHSHINLFEYPELLHGNAQEIVREILLNFSKENDDASCLVLRYLR